MVFEIFSTIYAYLSFKSTYFLSSSQDPATNFEFWDCYEKKSFSKSELNKPRWVSLIRWEIFNQLFFIFANQVISSFL